MAFCIPRHLTNLFKEKIKSGEITPENLFAMDSAQRHGFFASFLGETNATKVNALYESKLLLKSQKQGVINWAKQMLGPEVQKDIITRVNRLPEALNAKSENKFLEDLASQRIGTRVTSSEFANLVSLAKDVSDSKIRIQKIFKDENYSLLTETPSQFSQRMEYGRSKVAFDDYVNDLKQEASAKKLIDYVKPRNFIEGLSNVAGLAKSMKASLDNSVIGRQGLKVLLTNPKIWLKNSAQSFKDIWSSFSGKDVVNEVRAEVMSRPNALNGLYKKEGLAVGVREEAYPTSLPEKIPFLGKAFKASEAAFTGFQYRSRADIFDKYIEIADKSGADIKGIGQIANSLTGRGNLGKLEPVANIVNNVFFSPRFLKSNIDALTGHVFSKDLSPYSRRLAAVNTVKIIGGVAAVLAIAKAFDPKSVEVDPRSSDFGKIKIGNTRFDVTSGMSSIATLALRLITQSSKSSITNKVTKLNSDKFGAKTGTDVVYNFFENKLSPAASIVKDLINQKDFQGNKPTFLNEVNNLVAPLPITNYLELVNDPNSANILLAMIADELGISTNTYNKNKRK